MKFRGQFLLTKKHFNNNFNMNLYKIHNFKLFYSQCLNFNISVQENSQLILLGDLFSFENPNKNNIQILDDLNNINSEHIFFNKLSKFYGEYVIILLKENKFKILNDTTAQKEIYYNDNYTSFASSIKLISYSESLIKYKNNDIIEFYNSKNFKNNLFFVDDKTHYENIFHLKPNHYLNIIDKTTIRFFPNFTKQNVTLKSAALSASKIIKGYLKAISIRYPKLIIPLTSGYDSRVLFLASLGSECDYYVSQHDWMSNSHPDLVISKRLARLFDKDLSIIKDIENDLTKSDKDYTFSVDNPRNISFPNIVKNKTLINGNASEIVRCLFPRISKVRAEHLIFLNNYQKDHYILKIYNDWIKNNAEKFKEYGYDVLDMFYWEENMGNRLSKMKTEATSLGLRIFSPYSSRYLINIMLGVDEKYRNNFNTILYKEIIKNLSGNKKLDTIPFNPSFQTKIFKILRFMGLLNLYLRFRIFIKQILIK